MKLKSQIGAWRNKLRSQAAGLSAILLLTACSGGQIQSSFRLYNGEKDTAAQAVSEAYKKANIAESINVESANLDHLLEQELATLSSSYKTELEGEFARKASDRRTYIWADIPEIDQRLMEIGIPITLDIDGKTASDVGTAREFLRASTVADAYLKIANTVLAEIKDMITDEIGGISPDNIKDLNIGTPRCGPKTSDWKSFSKILPRNEYNKYIERYADNETKRSKGRIYDELTQDYDAKKAKCVKALQTASTNAASGALGASVRDLAEANLSLKTLKLKLKTTKADRKALTARAFCVNSSGKLIHKWPEGNSISTLKQSIQALFAAEGALTKTEKTKCAELKKARSKKSENLPSDYIGKLSDALKDVDGFLKLDVADETYDALGDLETASKVLVGYLDNGAIFEKQTLTDEDWNTIGVSSTAAGKLTSLRDLVSTTKTSLEGFQLPDLIIEMGQLEIDAENAQKQLAIAKQQVALAARQKEEYLREAKALLRRRDQLCNFASLADDPQVFPGNTCNKFKVVPQAASKAPRKAKCFREGLELQNCALNLPWRSALKDGAKKAKNVALIEQKETLYQSLGALTRAYTARLSAEETTYRRLDLDHRMTLLADIYAIKSWDNLVKGGIGQVAAYHQLGIKPELIAEFLGLAAITGGVLISE